MSFLPVPDPAPGDAPAVDAVAAVAAVAQVIVPRSSDIGGFAVRRALPSARRRMVGPFVFLDEMGPAEFRVHEGIDVRPHPHIGLATVTYLFDGELVHRDSLGTAVAIRPGAVNWMTAGRGIVHSERTGPDRRAGGGRLHGLQCWVALPIAAEEGPPAFAHHGAEELPVVAGDGVSARVVAGEIYGAKSPVAAGWETLFADVALAVGAALPLDPVVEERAVYLVSGEIEIAGDRHAAGRLLVIRPGDRLTLRAVTASRLAVLGGAPMDGPRHIWWNFVSSRKDRIEAAKADWKAGRFDAVPGETEFVPLPE